MYNILNFCIGHSDWQDFDFCQTFEFFISKTDKTGTFQEHWLTMSSISSRAKDVLALDIPSVDVEDETVHDLMASAKISKNDQVGRW